MIKVNISDQNGFGQQLFGQLLILVMLSGPIMLFVYSSVHYVAPLVYAKICPKTSKETSESFIDELKKKVLNSDDIKESVVGKPVDTEQTQRDANSLRDGQEVSLKLQASTEERRQNDSFMTLLIRNYPAGTVNVPDSVEKTKKDIMTSFWEQEISPQLSVGIEGKVSASKNMGGKQRNEEMKNYRRAFYHCDTNLTNSVDSKEMALVVKEFYSRNNHYAVDKIVDKILYENDKDKSGCIDFKEFVLAMDKLKNKKKN